MNKMPEWIKILEELKEKSKRSIIYSNDSQKVNKKYYKKE